MQVQVNIEYNQRKFHIRKIDDGKTVMTLQQSLANTLSLPVSQIEFLDTNGEPFVDDTTIKSILTNYNGQPLQSRERVPEKVNENENENENDNKNDNDNVRAPIPIVRQRLVDDEAFPPELDDADDELGQAIIASLADYQEKNEEETQLQRAYEASLIPTETNHSGTTRNHEPNAPLTTAYDHIQTPTTVIDDSVSLPEALYLTKEHFNEENVDKMDVQDIPVVTIPGQAPVVYRHGKTLVNQLIQLQEAGVALYFVAENERAGNEALRPIVRHCKAATRIMPEFKRTDCAPDNAHALENANLCDQLAELIKHLPNKQTEEHNVAFVDRVRKG